MHQSLYRVYRTRTFSEMKGQDHVVRTLKNQVAQNRWGHAYLFTGSRGTGKTSAARTLAMAINCLEPQGGDPCLKCAACKALESETTLDVFEMDAASNSRVEEIRELLEKVNYPPQFVRSKVYIIDEVHMLSNAAFNALLKTLEEPPEYMVFILATTEPQKIPATILSRCQRYDFGRLKEEDIVDRLKIAFDKGQQAEESALQLIAFAAEGSMRDAWSLTDMCLDEHGNLFEARVRENMGAVDQGFLAQFVDALYQGDAALSLRMIQELMSSGKDVQVFLKEISQHLRLLLGAKLGAAPPGLGSDKERRLKEQADRMALDRMTWMLERAMRAEGDLRWASQARTVLTVYALTCCQSGTQAGQSDTEPQASAPAASAAIVPPAPVRKPDPAPEPVKEPAPPPAPVTEPEEPLPLEAPPEAPPQGEMTAEDPAPAAASGDGPAAGMMPKDVWNRMLERAKKEAGTVHTLLVQGRFGGFSEGCYRLHYAADDQFLVQLVMEESRRAPIERILTEVGGAPARFEALSEEKKRQEVSAKQKAQQDIEALAAIFGRKNVIVEGQEP